MHEQTTPDRTPRASGPARGEMARDACAIALAGLVALIALRPLQDAPFVDDWTYAWSVDNLLRGGGLEFLEWTPHANAVQVLWGALFCLPAGFSFSALRASTWVMSTGGVIALYLLLRHVGVGRRGALIGSATLGLNPIYFMLSASFMTDVPLVALATWSMLAMVLAVARRSDGWLTAAALLAGLAIGVRSVGTVLPVAMALTLYWAGGPAEADGARAWGRDPRRLAIALLPLIVLPLLSWWRAEHLVASADVSYVVGSPVWRAQNLVYALPRLPVSLVQTLGAGANALGLGLLPVLLAGARRDAWRGTLACGAGLAVLLAIGVSLGMQYDRPLIQGSIWAVREIGGTEPTVSGPPSPDSALVTWALVPVVLLAAGHLLFILVRLRPSGPAQTFLAWVLVGQALVVALLWLFYDRYLLPLFIPALALALLREPVRRPRVAVLALAALALLSTVGLRDHLAYTRALWRGVAEARALGAPDAEINAGYAINGWLQYAHPEQAPRGPDGQLVVPWLNGSKDHPLRYWVANGPAPEYETARTVPYRRWLGRSGQIFVLERRAATGR